MTLVSRHAAGLGGRFGIRGTLKRIICLLTALSTALGLLAIAPVALPGVAPIAAAGIAGCLPHPSTAEGRNGFAIFTTTWEGPWPDSSDGIVTSLSLILVGPDGGDRLLWRGGPSGIPTDSMMVDVWGLRPGNYRIDMLIEESPTDPPVEGVWPSGAMRSALPTCRVFGATSPEVRFGWRLRAGLNMNEFSTFPRCIRRTPVISVARDSRGRAIVDVSRRITVRARSTDSAACVNRTVRVDAGSTRVSLSLAPGVVKSARPVLAGARAGRNQAVSMVVTATSLRVTDVRIRPR